MDFKKMIAAYLVAMGAKEKCKVYINKDTGDICILKVGQGLCIVDRYDPYIEIDIKKFITND